MKNKDGDIGWLMGALVVSLVRAMGYIFDGLPRLPLPCALQYKKY